VFDVEIFLDLLNETLAAGIVVVAVSLLLYNLTRNWRDRIARTSGMLLACISVVYIGDVLISLGPSTGTYINILRAQWIGIALMPPAMFHVSDALLATTGAPSRGRRARAVRLLYLIGIVFVLLAAFGDLLVRVAQVAPAPSLRAAPLFYVYIAFFLTGTIGALINVNRARQRCLTGATRRRMAYLWIAMFTPPLGTFPFSMLFPVGEEYTLVPLVLVNLANILVILLLLFLAYPLSFFGARAPDRIVKSELMSFLLRGPATGILALITIIYVPQTTRILGLPGDTFMPFAVVTVVLMWQWGIDIAIPILERRMIYSDEDADQLDKLDHLSERLLTQTDILQMLEGLLSALCDFLQVRMAFAAAAQNGDGLDLICAVGMDGAIQEQSSAIRSAIQAANGQATVWGQWWLIPLYSGRLSNGEKSLIGVLGVQARASEIVLTADERPVFNALVKRAARALDDMALQREVYAALEGLLPQFEPSIDRFNYKLQQNQALKEPRLIDDRAQMVDLVRSAFKHFWGGPGLTSSQLLELNTVKAAMTDHPNNGGQALQAILTQLINTLKPQGARQWTNEWLTYNILEMRFLSNQRVNVVAYKLNMSEANFYRKQQAAIETITDMLIRQEQAHSRATNGNGNSGTANAIANGNGGR
jgi:hypothetical protein